MTRAPSKQCGCVAEKIQHICYFLESLKFKSAITIGLRSGVSSVMEEINISLGQLTDAVRNLTGKTIIDYLLVVIPIVISVAAIVISIQGTRQQNRIALFDKRFSAYLYMQKCVVFDRLLENAAESNDAYQAYCSAFGKEHSMFGLNAVIEYRPIEERLMQSYLLFSFIDDETIKKCCDALLRLLRCIEAGKDVSAAKEYYHNQMSAFYKAIPQIQDMLTLK